MLVGLCAVESFTVAPPAAVRFARPQFRPRAVRSIDRRAATADGDAPNNSSSGDGGNPWAAPRGDNWVRPDVVEAAKQWARLSCAVALTPRSSLDQTNLDAKEVTKEVCGSVGRWSAGRSVRRSIGVGFGRSFRSAARLLFVHGPWKILMLIIIIIIII